MNESDRHLLRDWGDQIGPTLDENYGLVDKLERVPICAWREAVLREVAPLLAAVSPITVDLYLNERMLAPPDDAQRTLAREVFWNM